MIKLTNAFRQVIKAYILTCHDIFKSNRKRMIEDAKQKKFAELREAGVLDKYCKEVERKMKKNPQNKIFK